MKLMCQEDGYWKSDDGRVEIIHDHSFETECEEPHPVRMLRSSIDPNTPWGARILQAERFSVRGERGGKYISYLCPGGEVHFYSMWTVNVDGEWTPDVYEKFTQARRVAEDLVGPMTLGRRPRVEAPPAVVIVSERERDFDPATGIASWRACGHRAELDINECCYTCHQPV